tara:strand:+ start:12955 stop:13323 length:369 start_codon:yes stop_codon:yes gene_type:complete
MIGVALDVPHCPCALNVTQQISEHISLVGRVVGKTISYNAGDQADITNFTVLDHLLGKGVRGQESTLMTNNQLYIVAFTDHQHVGCGAETIGHWFLTQNRFYTTGCGGGDCHWSVTAMPDSD